MSVTSGPTYPPARRSFWYRQLPNALTLSRFALVPVFLLTFWCLGAVWVGRLTAAAVFIVAALTDRYDGKLARSNGGERVTDFGKIADPIADKAIVVAALVSLSVWLGLTWWPMILIALREVAVTVLRFVVIKDRVIAASPGGQLKTGLQMIFIIGYLVAPPQPVLHAGLLVLLWLAVIVTLVTGLDYFGRVYQPERTARLMKWADRS
jgi:CDP-diacylglycerol--glycerol-3-phosphate 3-phosphatidyltransferase